MSVPHDSKSCESIGTSVNSFTRRLTCKAGSPVMAISSLKEVEIGEAVDIHRQGVAHIANISLEELPESGILNLSVSLCMVAGFVSIRKGCNLSAGTMKSSSEVLRSRIEVDFVLTLAFSFSPYLFIIYIARVCL